MKTKTVITVLFVAVVLASCVPVTTLVPTETIVPMATITSTPMGAGQTTPTITPTLVPTIPLKTLSNVSYPDEKELSAVIQTYAESMTLNADEVKAGIEFQEFRDLQGNLFVLALAENGTPLLIADQNQNGDYTWREVGLKDIGQKIKFTFGASYTLNLPGGKYNDPRYTKIFERDFDAITISQGIYWQWLEPKQGTFDNYNLNDISDQLNIFAELNPKVVSGQSLFFAQSYPDWLKQGNFSRDELTQIMRSHIKSVLSFTKGVVSQWVVVNEPYFKTTESQTGFDYERPDILYKTMGVDYIELAFQIARDETPPGTILLYNDTNNHSSVPRDYSNGLYTSLTKENIEPLKAKGLIDGLGLQMHIQAVSPPSKDDLIRTMQSYGLPIYVTEIDVDLTGVPGTQKERFDLQAKLYSEALEACLESGVCDSFSFWDIGDHTSWLVVYGNKPNADATIFDKNFKPKPAYFALLEVLSEHLQP